MKTLILQKSRRTVAVLFAFILALSPLTYSIAQDAYDGGTLNEVGIKCKRTTFSMGVNIELFFISFNFAMITCDNGFMDIVQI